MKKNLFLRISSNFILVALLLLLLAAGCKKASPEAAPASNERVTTTLAPTTPAPLIIGQNNSSSGRWTAKLVSLESNGAGGYVYKTVGYVGTYHYPREIPFWKVSMGCGEVVIPGIDTQNWAGMRIQTIDGNYSACPSVTFRNKSFSPVFIYANSSLTLYY